MAVSGRGLVKAAENNYEKLDMINEMNELTENNIFYVINIY